MDFTHHHRAGLRLSARLHPLRAADHARCRPRRRAQDRLGQYRRDQCAAHRQQGARGADAAPRHAEGHRRRPDRWHATASIPPWRPASARSSATSFRSGSASRAARASPPISACCSALPGWWPCVFAAVWIAVAVVMRYSSLAALVAALVTPVALYLLGRTDLALLFVVMTVIVYVKHRANISRLLAGTECRIGAKG